MTWFDIMVLVFVVIPAGGWLWSLYFNELTIRTTHRLSSGDDSLGVSEGIALPSMQTSNTVTWSVIVPACNEEQAMAATIRSLLEQGESCQIIVIDDRSTDNTGVIIDEFAAQDSRVTAIHITSLPPGWLGKLNALEQGIQQARGNWLVIADADVVFAPRALCSAVAYAEQRKLNLLTAIPRIESAGFLGDLAMNATCTFLGSLGRFWQVPDPNSNAVAGLGAFLLLRREAFLQTPGFSWLKLEVADDVGVGLMMKQYTGHCEVALGADIMSLLWYSSYRDFVYRTQKNFFGILGRFSLWRTWAVAGMFLWISWFPVALLLPHSLPWLPWIVVPGWLALTFSTWRINRWLQRPWLPSLLPTLGWTLVAWAVIRAGWIGWRRKGIEWRGVFYPSTQLKPAQRVKY